MRGAHLPRGEQEKRKRGQEKDQTTTGGARPELAAAADEHLKKDKKKAREEHEEDRTELVTRSYKGLLALLLGARTLLGALGIATSNKDATRGSWHRY